MSKDSFVRKNFGSWAFLSITLLVCALFMYHLFIVDPAIKTVENQTLDMHLQVIRNDWYNLPTNDSAIQQWNRSIDALIIERDTKVLAGIPIVFMMLVVVLVETFRVTKLKKKGPSRGATGAVSRFSWSRILPRMKVSGL